MVTREAPCKEGNSDQSAPIKCIGRFIGTESFPYSDAFMGHAMRPENVGLMETPDGCGALADTSGYKMEIHLRIVNGRNEERVFVASGCLRTAACGSAVTSLAKGRSLRSAMKLTAGDVIRELEGLPPEYERYARLAVATLRVANPQLQETPEGAMGVFVRFGTLSVGAVLVPSPVIPFFTTDHGVR